MFKVSVLLRFRLTKIEFRVLPTRRIPCISATQKYDRSWICDLSKLVVIEFVYVGLWLCCMMHAWEPCGQPILPLTIETLPIGPLTRGTA